MSKRTNLYLLLASIFIQYNISAQTTTPVGGFGVTFETNSSTNNFPKITSVTPESPAQRANVAIGDFITKVGSRSTQNLSLEDVRSLLTGQVGTSCDVTIWRNNTEYPVTFYRYNLSTPIAPVGGFGITFETNSGTNNFPKVTGVNPLSPAQRANIIIGDFITKIGSRSTQNLSVEDVRSLILGQVGTSCAVTIWRNNTEYPITFYRYNLNDFTIGQVDNIYHLKATSQYQWEPLPGYVFVNNSPGDFSTKWQSGKGHPNSAYKIMSAAAEGYWQPLPGYSFVSKGDLQTVWTPGLNYPEKKIKSAQAEGTWQAYPGYVFKNPAVSLEVVAVSTTSSSSDTYLKSAVIEFGVGAVIQYFFGKNMLSDYLYKESIKDGVNYFKQ